MLQANPTQQLLYIVASLCLLYKDSKKTPTLQNPIIKWKKVWFANLPAKTIPLLIKDR